MADDNHGTTLELALLGVPVRYSSNNSAVIAVVERAFGHWRALPERLMAKGPALEITIVVQPPIVHTATGPLVVRAHGDTVLFAAGDMLASARLARGEALACVSPALVADEPALRALVVERLGLLLVSARDRTPIAAVGLVRNGRALLLLGAAEPAQLTDACRKAGFGLLADNVVHVSREQGPLLWGHHAVPPGALEPGDITDRGSSNVCVPAAGVLLCVVERSAEQASRIEPLATAEAAARIVSPPGVEFAPLQEQVSAVAAILCSGGAYRLSVGTDPKGAALLLAHLSET